MGALGSMLASIASPGCWGGQTGQPDVSVWECSDACCGEGEPDTGYDVEVESDLIDALVEIEGEYEVPLFWLPPTSEIPLLPSEAMPLSSSTLRLELEYVGGQIVTTPECSETPLVPVRAALGSADGMIDTEFLALAYSMTSTGQPIHLRGFTGYPKTVELVTTVPDSAGSDIDTLYVQVSRASLLDLPRLGERPLSGEPGFGSCVDGPELEFDSEFGAVGHLCPGENGLAVWPAACGGIASLTQEHDVGGYELDHLLKTGRLESTGELGNLIDVELNDVGEGVCATRFTGGMTQGELTFGVAGERITKDTMVRIEPRNESRNAEAYFDEVCFDYDEGLALTQIAMADQGSVIDSNDGNIVGGRACVDGFVSYDGENLGGALEVLVTFGTEDGRQITRGYGMSLK